ncbi:uncharacterized protein Eint_081710 [Encephalitozoon intestinalis ATCC 50506]|uniref:Uncharacterized protein n=1 Tax=Encephalitozoon intestinalis (strain ATCC 50506) TaxID=876142 RepID=E0S8R5_ENCIT|nr:uncharacterized protein Eint_081710 [Encephalitozoon intestinalis ATCC 50506]ADM12103.1 hypothetical protein Eint_081710 [Encephalitozoon intestinalis ATCC 50506]UTX45895.1 hypothetical protein GPK93_08g14740 [Encephalitozoon intestinalis]
MKTRFGLKPFIFLSVFSSSNMMFAAKLGLAMLGIVYPCMYGLITLICLVLIQKNTVYKLIGIGLIVLYLKMLLGPSFGLEESLKECISAPDSKANSQDVDEYSSSSEDFIEGDGKIDSHGCTRENEQTSQTLDSLSNILNNHNARCRFCSGVTF